MPLVRRQKPFSDPGWIYEIKWDGFRSVAVIEDGPLPTHLGKGSGLRGLFKHPQFHPNGEVLAFRALTDYLTFTDEESCGRSNQPPPGSVASAKCLGPHKVADVLRLVELGFIRQLRGVGRDILVGYY